MADALNNKIFQDANKARTWLEKLLWVGGRSCGYCGTVDESTPIKGRDGYYQCRACRKQFTVQVGTVFERSHIPLNKWLMVAFLLCASKKGISAHQIHRMVGITYKSAWFMCHRLREAMAPLAGAFGPLGGDGKIIEADETYLGKTDIQPKMTTKGEPFTKGGKSGPSGKRAVVSLVERGGNVRSFHVDHADAATVRGVLVRNASRQSRLMTDESRLYTKVGQEFREHETTNHSAKEYVRGDVTTNSVEGFFSIFKRGMKGVYQHCGEAHLHRYLAEFDFRYNNRSALGVEDVERTANALTGIVGKRLTYRRIGEAAKP